MLFTQAYSLPLGAVGVNEAFSGGSFQALSVLTRACSRYTRPEPYRLRRSKRKNGAPLLSTGESETEAQKEAREREIKEVPVGEEPLAG